ncbi:MAG: nitrate/nitrite transporter NrtS [Piscinibacter sp.]|uniref:nitrate/nitrite transporter NrtS n=1 Tax=Piscinibacter sp. TaxID=1903157 RepID=UPI003D1108C0
MPGDQPRSAVGVWRLILMPRIVHSALKVSLVVGTVLNVINNGEQFWSHHTVNLWQAALNFVVPYCVSSYSAARNEAQRARGD